MRRVIELIKNTLAEGLYRTGLLRLILLIRFRKQAAVLMYHRVLPENGAIDSFSADSIQVTPQEFDWQMGLLCRYMRPTDLAGLIERVEGRTASPPSRSCVVSFDDGWFDNREFALPILQKHRVPAVIFVATSFIGTPRCFWQEKLGRMLHAAWQNPALGRRLLPLVEGAELAQTSSADTRRIARSIVSRIKSWPSASIDALLEQASTLCRECGVDPDYTGDDRFMSWQDVVDTSRSGLVSIESHAVSHVPLTRLPETARFEELTESRRLIEAKTGQRVAALAYPNGDFDAAVVESSRRAGYRLAVTTIDGAVAAGDDPLSLKRISIHKAAARTPARFLCRVAGLL